MKNQKIRDELKKSRLTQWELADLLGISEFTLSRRLRKELPDSETKHILSLIKKKGGKEE
jgi:DNA-binding transcriptional regulator YiaG